MLRRQEAREKSEKKGKRVGTDTEINCAGQDLISISLVAARFAATQCPAT